MTGGSLQEFATLLGGHVNGNRVLAPGPGHSADDRSLSVWPAKNEDGFAVLSFSPKDDRESCIAHVKELLDPEKHLGDGFDGIFAKTSKGKYKINLPLIELEVPDDTPNCQFIEDYWFWFWNWR